jgi:hypothetical protein
MTLRFNVNSPHWAVANQVHPIKDIVGDLLGAFLIVDGGVLSCFINSKESEVALNVSAGIDIFATYELNLDGSIQTLVLSTVKISHLSQKIKITTPE